MQKLKYINKNKHFSLPKTPGVYVFKSGKKLLYIGKAKNIKERVENHFQQSGFKDEIFIKEARTIGFLKTASEIEALLLEAALIKKYQPKFNVIWKDDKNYFYVAITKEDFPRIFVTHQPISTNSKKLITNSKEKKRLLIIRLMPLVTYIGPFIDGKSLKQALKILRRIFRYRTCKTIPKKPCLYYDLGLCLGPCQIKIKVQNAKCKMTPNNPPDGGYTGQADKNAEIIKIRKEYQANIKNLIKVLQGKKIKVLKTLQKEMSIFSKAEEFEKAAARKNQIKALKRVFENSRIFQEPPQKKLQEWIETERALRKFLNLQNAVKRLEGYDISNIQGLQATGSMAVFENGIPNKNEYRKFKIRISGKPNDIAMLKEVIQRRLKHKEWPLPQIMLIDGGKAQLGAAIQCKVQNSKFKVVAIAKRKNELFVEGQAKPILLKNLSPKISNLILHLRDEAHRFALSYHLKLRKKNLFKR